ncbi:unnamed protein product [Amaranthus hypochondriacus]
MKGIDFSCASPASTAICSSTDQNLMVKNSTKSFNRLNNHHYKSYSPRAPCISELPFTPRLSSSYREKPRKNPSSIVKLTDLITPRRKSSVNIDDFRRFYEKCSYNTSLLSPPRGHSSRYLLGDESNHHDFNVTKNSKYDNYSNGWALVPSTPILTSSREEVNEKKSFGSYLDAEKEKKIIKSSLVHVNHGDQRVIKSVNTKFNNNGDDVFNRKQQSMGFCKNDSLVLKKSSSSDATQSRDQVVVLRVSLHCKGCAGKLRKHLSKMEGVTSFSIDLETKKVTVKGNVTPLSVLTSISKVKNAQFWPSPVSNSPSSSSSSSNSSMVEYFH